MRTTRGLIFSLDAFVSFTLMLMVVHALIFLYSLPRVPIAHFVEMKQLAHDILYSYLAINGSSMGISGGLYSNKPMLFYIVKEGEVNPGIVPGYFGKLIPLQYGYRVEYRRGGSSDWEVLYSSAANTTDPHNNVEHVMSAVVGTTFYITTHQRSGYDSCYKYGTCHGSETPCDFPVSLYNPGKQEAVSVRLVLYR